GGACQSLDGLASAAKAASNEFPKAQAEAVIFECRTMQANNLDQLMALEKEDAGQLDAAKLRPLLDKIASDYANQGVAAEDRKDPYAAVIAYRHAIEWNPGNAKARFNLGAIYIDDKRYELAEKEYRALVQADTTDYEALYWLGRSILAQRPALERAAEACGLLKRSLAGSDPGKKAAFAKAVAAAKCANWGSAAGCPGGAAIVAAGRPSPQLSTDGPLRFPQDGVRRSVERFVPHRDKLPIRPLDRTGIAEVASGGIGGEDHWLGPGPAIVGA